MVSTIAGYVFEGVITALTGAKTAGGNANFDFPAASLTGNRNKLSSLFGSASGIKNLAKADAKATAGADKFNVSKSGNIPKKVVNDINAGILSGVQILKGPSSDVNNPLKNRVKKASGGGISGSDTVPAMLTPGEFVINKKAASSIGTANLSRMNKTGVQGFANGGAVGVRKYSNGTGPLGVTPGSFGSDLILKAELEAAKKEIKKLGQSTKQSSETTRKSTKVEEAILKFEKEANKSRQTLIKKLSETRIGGAAAKAGRGVGRVGKAVGRVGKRLGGTDTLLAAGSLAAFIPQVEGATEGLGAVQNVAAEAAIQFTALTAVGQQFGPLGSAFATSIAVVTTATKVIDAYTGVHLKATEALEKAKKATDERSLVDAENKAAASAGQKALNKFAVATTVAGAGVGALIGSAFGPVGTVVGTAVGGLVGALAGLAIKLNATEEGAARLNDFFASLGFGQLTSQIKANVRFTVENARAQKVLAEASKEAAEELKKIQSGEVSVADAVGEGGSVDNIAKAIARVSAAGSAVTSANRQQSAKLDKLEQTGFGRLLSTVSGARGRIAESNASVASNQKALQEQLVNSLAPFTNELTRSVVTSAAAGGGDGSSATFDDFFGKLSHATRMQLEASDSVGKLREQFENQKQAVIDNIKFVKAMNFGLSGVVSGIAAYGASLDNLVASQETGFSTAGVAATTLATAISSAGANISSAELGRSLDLLEGNLQKFGANAKQISGARDLITGLNDVQKGAADALAAVKAGFKGEGADPKAIQGQLRDAILNAVPDDSPIKEKLINAFPDKLPPDVIQSFLNTGDVSGILDAAFGPVEESVKKQLIEPLKKMAEQEKILVGLAVQRREAEQQLIAVQKKAIDTQIDAAKSLEFFGGPKFTPEKEFDARRRQANLTLQDSGIAGLATGSAADIRSASDSLMSQFSNQQAAQNAAAITGGGAFGGVAGVDKDRRAELKASNQALIDITKSGIEQRKQELDLIKKKNQAEKDALNSLLGGDVESFFDQAIGAAAGSALRTGDAAAASLFGAGALGTGLQGLQGTGLSDAENSRASQLAFGAFGLGEDAARTFSGTTTEEERIKAEGRELSQLQSELADQSVDLEEMTVSATTVVITAANLKMQDISDQVTRAQNIAGFNRGGVVYANKGMFIPRGTDTVPAMLTPGEFVVNRAAVQRGNNLQMLRSMNSNSAPTQATQNLSSGGPVRYRANGSTGPEGPGGIDLSKFEDMVNKFQEVTDKLGNVNIKHMFEKLGTLDINHMFNGNMQQAFKDEILSEAGNMMARSKFNNDGSITTSDRSVLG